MELVLPKNYVEVTEEEMSYLDGGGSFGVTLKISTTTRNKGKYVAAGIAAAVVANALKPMDTFGIYGLIAKGTIMGITAYYVHEMVERALTSRTISVYIKELNFSFVPTVSF